MILKFYQKKHLIKTYHENLFIGKGSFSILRKYLLFKTAEFACFLLFNQHVF